MSQKRKGSGRLVPTRPTGVEYRVNYGLHLVVEVKQHGRGIRPARWARCSVKSANANRIPEGLAARLSRPMPTASPREIIFSMRMKAASSR